MNKRKEYIWGKLAKEQGYVGKNITIHTAFHVYLGTLIKANKNALLLKNVYSITRNKYSFIMGKDGNPLFLKKWPNRVLLGCKFIEAIFFTPNQAAEEVLKYKCLLI
jgi:hypothetical protein